jgi:long-subunit acyl-CoA synthetase (AMP-forming)
LTAAYVNILGLTPVRSVRGGAPLGFGCAHALVLSKVKAALGLDRAKMCITSAAPISVQVLNYFASLDIPVLELFGQSESTGPHTSNFSNAWKIGSIGRDVSAQLSVQAGQAGMQSVEVIRTSRFPG